MAAARPACPDGSDMVCSPEMAYTPAGGFSVRRLAQRTAATCRRHPSRRPRRWMPALSLAEAALDVGSRPLPVSRRWLGQGPRGRPPPADVRGSVVRCLGETAAAALPLSHSGRLPVGGLPAQDHVALRLQAGLEGGPLHPQLASDWPGEALWGACAGQAMDQGRGGPLAGWAVDMWRAGSCAGPGRAVEGDSCLTRPTLLQQWGAYDSKRGRFRKRLAAAAIAPWSRLQTTPGARKPSRHVCIRQRGRGWWSGESERLENRARANIVAGA